MRGKGPRRGLKSRGLLGPGAVFAGRVRVLPARGGRERGVSSLSVPWKKQTNKNKASSFVSEPSKAAFVEDKSVVLHVSALFNLFGSCVVFSLSVLSSSF